MVALVDHVVHAATTTRVGRVNKRSRAVWSVQESKILQDHGYHPQMPKIVTIEVVGTAFFGSSLLLLQGMTEEVGIDLQEGDPEAKADMFRSPATPGLLLMREGGPPRKLEGRKATVLRRPPKFVVLDLAQVTNLDASVSRGCFLQFARMCAKRGMTVCAAGASPRIDWMLRSHEVAYDLQEENNVKALYQSRFSNISTRSPLSKIPAPASDRIILFMTTYEALEFCENALIHQVEQSRTGPSGGFERLKPDGEQHSLSSIFARSLGLTGLAAEPVQRLDGQRYHEEVEFQAGDDVFVRDTHADAFYVVLRGAVAVALDPKNPRQSKYRRKKTILSGGGMVRQLGSSSDLFDPSLSDHDMVVSSLWPVGGVFGYTDFLLERPRLFRAVATQDRTLCAKITMSHMNLVRSEDAALDGLIQRVLLNASILDLANCTCDE